MYLLSRHLRQPGEPTPVIDVLVAEVFRSHFLHRATLYVFGHTPSHDKRISGVLTLQATFAMWG
jgi:hypothetical protein